MSDVQQGPSHYCCFIHISQIKALLSVFKSRITDSRGGDTAIERCDVSIEDQPNKVQCRLIVKMICRLGMSAVSLCWLAADDGMRKA